MSENSLRRQSLQGATSNAGDQDIAGYSPRVVVKFRDEVELPYEDGAERYIEELGIGPWDELASEFGGITLRRLFRAMDEGRIRKLLKQAALIDPGHTPGNLLLFFAVDCPDGVDPEKLARAFRAWPAVQTAYFDPPGSDPVTVSPAGNPRFDNQGYLNPAPIGIDAEFAWPRPGNVGYAGGDGATVNVIDMEQGWTLDHEDLAAHGAAQLNPDGAIRDSSRAHGTETLGVVCAVDNNKGCIGIAPSPGSVNVVSYWDSTRADAMLAAIGHLQFGDVLLLEAEITIPGLLKHPIEVLDAEFQMIRLATALGITVVEAGGNGATDLDAYIDTAGEYVLDRSSDEFLDSGAIVVGAASSAAPHKRLAFSNFGSRVDCYAWGENVNTASSDDAGSTAQYTTIFKGTSSASAIIAGAATLIQGIAQASLGYRFSARQMRDILSDPLTGTISDAPNIDRIGVMPDLKGILQGNVLNLAPDVYIRDFVGDTGVGSEVEAGQDNHVYLRLLNRGGSDASNVEATVYWAPVATLLMPDLWTRIGSITLPVVVAGNVLTVSPPLTWPAQDIPGPGHYCFVAIIGHSQDPAPDPANFSDWASFQLFVRNRNNVTWRNFNVVDNEPDPLVNASFVELPFLAPGPADGARHMHLNVVAKLPRGGRAILEIPPEMRDALDYVSPAIKIDKKNKNSLVPINPHGASSLGNLLFPANYRGRLKLHVHIPEKARQNPYELYVTQVYKGQEMGRVTWRLVPAKIKQKIPENIQPT
jgi:hypothetical protein